MRRSYDRLRPLSYPQTDCFMLCFAVNDWASLEEARDKFVPEVRRSCPTTPIILVGTKADLRETDGASSLIPVATGVELAKALGLVAYVECSAKTSRNVFETVRLAIKVPLLKDAGLLRLLAHHNAGKKGKKQKKAGDKCALQ
jgi:GTPase SAR1 family protein